MGESFSSYGSHAGAGDMGLRNEADIDQRLLADEAY
jgi:hypothetical protein